MKESFLINETVEISVEIVDKDTGESKPGLSDVKILICNPDGSLLVQDLPMIQPNVSLFPGVYKRSVSYNTFTFCGQHFFKVTTADISVKPITGSFYREYPARFGGNAGIVGEGAKQIDIEVLDANGYPIEGVECWVTTDFGGVNVVGGTLVTDTNGIVTFMLDPGDLYLWRQCSKVDFPNPKMITIV